MRMIPAAWDNLGETVLLFKKLWLSELDEISFDKCTICRFMSTKSL